jgi:SAM-dependent methyltransferase
MKTETVADKIFHFCANIFSYVPSSAWFCVRKLTSVKGARILDVGCGQGDMARISGYQKGNYVIGVDLYKPYLQISKRKKTYADIVLCDARFLPFKHHYFDILICLEVIEHFNDKKTGFEALTQFEELAKTRTILSTPVGYSWQRIIGENEWQEHHIGWVSGDLTPQGYKVSYVGLPEGRAVRTVKHLLFKLVDSAVSKNKKTGQLGTFWSTRLCDMLTRIPYYLLGKLTFQSKESKAGHMICSKELN